MTEVETDKIQKIKEIISDACFQNVLADRKEVIDDMLLTTIGEIADTMTELINLIYVISEVVNE